MPTEGLAGSGSERIVREGSLARHCLRPLWGRLRALELANEGLAPNPLMPEAVTLLV